MTDNERAVLIAIDASEYGDSATDPIWTWSAAEHSGLIPRTFAGTCGALAKKGLIRSMEDGADSTIEMTAAGVAALIADGYIFRKEC